MADSIEAALTEALGVKCLTARHRLDLNAELSLVEFEFKGLNIPVNILQTLAYYGVLHTDELKKRSESVKTSGIVNEQKIGDVSIKYSTAHTETMTSGTDSLEHYNLTPYGQQILRIRKSIVERKKTNDGYSEIHVISGSDYYD